MWLTIFMNNWKSIALASVIVVAIGAGWKMGASHIQSQWDAEKAAIAIEMQEAMVKHAAMIQKLEVQHDKDETDIRDYKRTHPSKLYLPTSSCTRPSSASASIQATTRDESFSSPAQQAIDRYTAGVDALMLQADLVVNDCRVMKDYLMSLGK